MIKFLLVLEEAWLGYVIFYIIISKYEGTTTPHHISFFIFGPFKSMLTCVSTWRYDGGAVMTIMPIFSLHIICIDMVIITHQGFILRNLIE